MAVALAPGTHCAVKIHGEACAGMGQVFFANGRYEKALGNYCSKTRDESVLAAGCVRVGVHDTHLVALSRQQDVALLDGSRRQQLQPVDRCHRQHVVGSHSKGAVVDGGEVDKVKLTFLHKAVRDLCAHKLRIVPRQHLVSAPHHVHRNHLYRVVGADPGDVLAGGEACRGKAQSNTQGLTEDKARSRAHRSCSEAHGGRFKAVEETRDACRGTQ